MNPPEVPGYRGVPLPPVKHPERRDTPEGTARIKDELARERAEDAKHEVRAIREEFQEYRREQQQAFNALKHDIADQLKPIQATLDIHDSDIKMLKGNTERRHDMKKTIWTVVGGGAGLLVGSLVTGWFQYAAQKQAAANAAPSAVETQKRDAAKADEIRNAVTEGIRQYAKERDKLGEPADTIVASGSELAGPRKQTGAH